MTTPDPGAPAPRSAVQEAWAAEALDEHWTGPDGTEDLHDGGTQLLDLVATVDHLARGLRHDFTVWDALDEALHWWLTEQTGHTDGAIEDHAGTAEEDPLRGHMAETVDHIALGDSALAGVLQQAIRHWTTTMAERFNNGYHWPHPDPRRGFPPPAVRQ